MKINKEAIAGTLESSDIQITISKNHLIKNTIYLESPVKHLYEVAIKKVIMNTLEKHQITNANVKAIDQGALDCTIIARTQSAIYRATEKKEINWEAID